ncbi:hypothetical protein [Micromonospora sp. NPDC093277]|uniref:hypothetical protein n=1 Tax=Micromonospora sp. NPDC093277 TaxID=3364291 RepID=UPI0038139580
MPEPVSWERQTGADPAASGGDGLSVLCRILAVSRSGFYRWTANEPGRQDRAVAEDASPSRS